MAPGGKNQRVKCVFWGGPRTCLQRAGSRRRYARPGRRVTVEVAPELRQAPGAVEELERQPWNSPSVKEDK